ncbi:FAD binding domain-containing protein [Massarina eburnea CBS 473.64]|uniref:FAD binding domain-containing protein n=1 Tax=Massarina eburnea CBS 473.64 TaxID=1395130 RepID=A0A6A6SE52_9PLEO|nr:FAD binding domain-containing protein [Massarina eburnea CBS 473.64]
MWLFSSLSSSSSSSSPQSSTLFAYERKQLTREYIASLPDEDKQLLAFDNQFGTNEVNKTDKRCRYGPADGKWPSEKAWERLSKQLSTATALIKTTPQASPCYGDTKNDVKCQEMTKNWYDPYSHIDDPTEILSPMYQGLTCQPPSVYNSTTCTLGGYPSYVVGAKAVLDIQLGINFARNNNIRLVVKNTGHDFAGKSIGAGSLSIWTHGLKDIQVFDNYVDDSGYRGPAVKAGAGVQAFELYKAVSDKGYAVVAGEGHTVGVMGGYIQGGGHSPLSSLYGMAADHVLSFEVVTSIGELVTANSSSNSDLFWALRGGGGATFGVVTSVTVKAYKDMQVTAASWSFNSSKLGVDKFWTATKAFIDNANIYADKGIYTYFMMASFDGKDYIFNMAPFFAPNKTANETNAILAPYLTHLTGQNIPFSPKVTEYKGFYGAWQAEFGLEGVSNVQTAIASRLFQRSNFNDDKSRTNTFNVLRQTLESNQSIIAFNLAPTLARGNADNAVNPAWRSTVIHAIAGRGWDIRATPSEILAARKVLTTVTLQKWRDITPNSGSYLNEADRMEPNWQQSFWGDKYAKLLDIKKDRDTKNVFWAVNSVGSEGWVVESVDGLPNENGKLCKVNGTSSTVADEPMLMAF